MTERDNLLRTVRFEEPDYIPMVFHINGSCWHNYSPEALQDLMASHPVLFPEFDKSSPPTVEHPPFARAGKEFVDPWGCVWEITESGMMGTVIKHPLENWDNFGEYLPPDPNKTGHWGPIDWDEQAKKPGPAVVPPGVKNGSIGHNHTWLKLIDIRGYQNVLFDMADGEPRLFKLLEMLETFNSGLLKNWLERVGVELIDFAEDLGMQSGPMLSPEHFKRYIKPSYQRLMSKARESGCIVHVHADGDVRVLMEDLLECGIDVINIQDLVNGINWIRDNLKGRVCINLDIDRQNITFKGTPSEIDALILKEVEELGSKKGGLMMVYGLYPGVPLDNAKAVMDSMERYRTYYR